MHWRHVSITTMPCWGSRLVALRARVVLAERIGAQPSLSVSARARRYGMQGLASGCMLGDGARGSASFDPQHAGAPFCDVICIWSILVSTSVNWMNGITWIGNHNNTCNFIMPLSYLTRKAVPKQPCKVIVRNGSGTWLPHGSYGNTWQLRGSMWLY